MFGLGAFWDTHMSWDAWKEVLGYYPWHTQYPTQLRREFDERRFTVDPDHDRPLDPRAYSRLLAKVKDYARASVSRRNLAYHNEQHFASMAASATMLFDRTQGNRARSGPLVAIRQAIEIAAWLHDCHHSGCTLRADSPRRDLHRPELGTNVSAELVSAIAANDLLTHAGLPIQWRSFIVNLILMTTFGGEAAQQRGIKNIPVISNVCTPYFALMRVADVWPPSDIHVSTQQGIDVNCHETPATGKITDPAALLRAQAGFQRYRLAEMQHLDRVCGQNITADGQTIARQHERLFSQAASDSKSSLMQFAAQRMV